MADSLTVWDSDSAHEAQSADNVVYLWNGYEEKAGEHSLLKYVEANGERLRRKYLSWVHELGKSDAGQASLVERLRLPCGLSYWWLSSIAEKSPWKSPKIQDAIRLLALEEILLERKPRVCKLRSARKDLHLAIGILCKGLGVLYKREAIVSPHRQPISRRLYRLLPYSLQGLLSLAKYLQRRVGLRASQSRNWYSGRSSLLFCSYFIHLDAEALRDGRFESEHWGPLPAFAQEKGLEINWLQHFCEHQLVPDSAEATRFVHSLNSRPNINGHHVFVDAFLSIGVVFAALIAWFRLTVISYTFSDIERSFRPNGSVCDFWPILNDEWRDNLRGAKALLNVVTLELFNAALCVIPRQARGFYLLENQAWERAFIHNWRRHGHGELVGVAHSTIRFWDLRYFADPRTFNDFGDCAPPRPDKIVLNGSLAIDTLRAADQPDDTFAECEALRYLRLSGSLKAAESRESNSGPLRILVLGDYLPQDTEKTLSLLCSATRRLSGLTRATVKPHPNCPVDVKHYPELELKLTNKPLAHVLNQFDVVYSSNLTSAALDAYLAGLPVVVMLDPTSLNFSPLRDVKGVRFASSAEELAAIFSERPIESPSRVEVAKLLHLDSALSRWNRLLCASAS